MLIINPGSGPVAEATEENAAACMAALVADLGPGHTFRRGEFPDDEGRFAFIVTTPSGAQVEVDMPGLPVDQVRYIDPGAQNIWDFPPLYVNGSSWVWFYALTEFRAAEAAS